MSERSGKVERRDAGDGPVGPTTDPEAAARVPRPMIERLGLFAIAVVLASLFGGIAAALVSGGELFLGVMAVVGCLMTLWVGGLTLLRG